MNFLTSLLGSGGGESSSHSLPTHNESDLSGGNIHFASGKPSYGKLLLIGGFGLAAVYLITRK